MSVDHKIQFRDMSEIMVLKRSHVHLQRMRQISPTEKQTCHFVLSSVTHFLMQLGLDWRVKVRLRDH